MVVSYSKELYTRDPSMNYDGLANMTLEQIFGDMNTQPCKELSNDEISDALFHIDPKLRP
jgi:hypothetical protein